MKFLKQLINHNKQKKIYNNKIRKKMTRKIKKKIKMSLNVYLFYL